MKKLKIQGSEKAKLALDAESKKIVFLDCDDVINTPKIYNQAFNVDLSYLDSICADDADPGTAGRDTAVGRALYAQGCSSACTVEAKGVLNWIAATYDCLFVISSTWANTMSKDNFEDFFLKAGINITLHEDWKTPRPIKKSRADCIKNWLSTNNVKANFLILDDTESGSSLIGNALQKNSIFCDYDNQLKVGDKQFQVKQGLNKSHIELINKLL